ncbi:hypothetical protein ACFQWB_13740 [Paenibacillus thermoaerophilus]|uniref:Uncharacterized protein n=1 Tax=Paenibacillus thermoaerophilus TaxID=1215385 RepID=A0ABW2V5Z8_9BACL|nr:hypothetical protein [Paenibacillus thermoaerophilus]TMV16118.1 hypothetical protein FE781_08585 [Paenibacillus thermoaerophilus]
MENLANMVSPYGGKSYNEPMYVSGYEKGCDKGSVAPYGPNQPFPVGPCVKPWYTCPGPILVLFILLIIVLRGRFH